MCPQSQSPRVIPKANFLSFEYQENAAKKIFGRLQEEFSKYIDKSKEYKSYRDTLSQLQGGKKIMLSDIQQMLENLKKEKISDKDREKRYAHFKLFLVEGILNSIENRTDIFLQELRTSSNKSKKPNNAALKSYLNDIGILLKDGVSYLQIIKSIFNKKSTSGNLSEMLADCRKYCESQNKFYDTAVDIRIYKVYPDEYATEDLAMHSKVISFGKPEKSVKINIPAARIEKLYLQNKNTLANANFTGNEPDDKPIYIVDAQDPAEVFKHGIDYHLGEVHKGKLMNEHGHVIYFDRFDDAKAFVQEHLHGENYDNLGGWRQKKTWEENDRAEVRQNFIDAQVYVKREKLKTQVPHHKQRHVKKPSHNETPLMQARPTLASAPSESKIVFEAEEGRATTPKSGMNPAFFSAGQKPELASAPSRSKLVFDDEENEKEIQDTALQEGEKSPESSTLSREIEGEARLSISESQPGLPKDVRETPDSRKLNRNDSLFQQENKEGEQEEIEGQPHEPQHPQRKIVKNQ